MVLRTFGGRDCIELPEGTIAQSGVEAGDELVFDALN
jgi:uncharacterized membrane protein (UPF0127 family)